MEVQMDNQLMVIFVGIIAVCMVLITSIVLYIGFEIIQSIKMINKFVAHVENELSFISTKAAVTLHDLSELVNQLKGETRNVGEKGQLALHEMRNLIAFLHDEAQSLALKASNGIAKVTIGTLAIGALSQIFKKSKS